MTSSSLQTSVSVDWFERAREVMPGGVNSPVRAFRSVGGVAPFVTSGQGARVVTSDGEELIDLVASWGALIFGHADPNVTAAVVEAVGRGSSFGMSTTAEVELAELICQIVPSIDVVRMVNSGTEATASLLRLARAATGRDSVIKFQGCYDGFHDYVLRNVLSRPEGVGRRDPHSAGMLEAAIDAAVAATMAKPGTEG